MRIDPDCRAWLGGDEIHATCDEGWRGILGDLLRAFHNVLAHAKIVDMEDVLMRHRLIYWCIFRLPSGSAHLNGLAKWEGCVSSLVMSFDPATMTAVIRSGNGYDLAGEPGFHPDAWWVRGEWLQRNGLLETDVVPIGVDDLRPRTEDAT